MTKCRLAFYYSCLGSRQSHPFWSQDECYERALDNVEDARAIFIEVGPVGEAAVFDRVSRTSR